MNAKVTMMTDGNGSENGSRLVQFGIFELDLRAGELRRDGRKVKVQEQPFQLLTVLLERPGDVVSRDELRTRLWPADTFVDFDHGLNAAIRRLRDALNDSAENPRFVETVARRGYRFIAPVSVPTITRVHGNRAVQAQVATTSKRFHIGRLGWITAASIALVALGIVLGVLLTKKPPEFQMTERKLTANPSEDEVTAGAISPDGKYLAFADMTGFYLRVIASGETHAMPALKDFKVRSLSWFPDASHLVMDARDSAALQDSLWDVSLLGGTPRKLIDDGTEPAVSPDVSRIAFLRGAPKNHKMDCGCRELWVMQSDGQNPRAEVTDPDAVIGQITWSADGRHVAYPRGVFRGYERSAWLEVHDLTTGKSETIISNPRLGGVLAWTRQGRLIYSLVELPPNTNESNLWSARIDNDGHITGAPQRVSSDSGFNGDLSISSDGKRLATVKGSSQPDVFITDIEARGTELSSPKLLTLDERQDYPYAWTPDSKAVIFSSDRDGVFHIFKQQIDKPTPDLVMGGDQPLTISRLSPDGKWVIYISQARLEEQSTKVRLMRMPLAGGPPQLLLEAPAINNQQCSRLPVTVCLYSQVGEHEMSFFKFDPDSGKSEPMPQLKLAGEDYYDFNWTLSPDGRTLATAGGDALGSTRALRLVPLDGRPARELKLNGWTSINNMDWAADAKSIWVNATNSTGVRTLINVDLQGRVRPMMEDKRMLLGWAIPSPDGRHLAIWKASGSSNVWMLENF